MKNLITRFNGADLLQISGACSISGGCFLIAPAVGFITSGFFLLLFGVAVQRNDVDA